MKPKLVNQPTAKPTRKVTGGGVAGLTAVVVLWAAGLVGLDMPEDVAVAIGALIGVIAATLGAYLVRERQV